MGIWVTGLALMLIGGGFILGADQRWIKTVASMVLIAGFMIFALDMMRLRINRNNK